MSPLKRSILPPADAPFSASIGPARFYLDDVQDVYLALLEFSKVQREGAEGEPERTKPKEEAPEAGRVQIRALNASADEVADLTDATRSELNHLSLILSSPKIRIDLWSHEAEVIAESDTPNVRAFANSINDYAWTRRNRILPILRATRGVLFLWIVIIFGFIGMKLPKHSPLYLKPDSSNYAVIGVVAAMSLIGIAVAYRARRDSIRVIPMWRSEGRRLSSQTSREIGIAIIGAVILGLLGFWAGLFIKK
jgi:hypothetical protein